MTKTLAAAATLVGAAALFAAGCGSSGKTTSTNASPAVDWANSLCSATTTWTDALKQSASSVKSQPTADGLGKAADDARKATDAYLSTLSGLGEPGTSAGGKAKAEVDKLRTELQSGVATMKDAAAKVSDASGMLQAVSTISGTLASMGKQVEATMTNLKQLDPQGELKQAIAQADACTPYAA